ncbi:hypothetical protein [Lysinibacillus sp. NPDC096212]|uniref:hypothetical protein n=1 Tax=Lysinibacillus sp. NPDC096212 TaxID=3364135 RepID=UPI0037FA4321
MQQSDSNSTDVGHEGVITGCDGFSLRSSIADPQGVAQSPLQSTYAWHTFTINIISNEQFIEEMFNESDNISQFS